MRITGAKHVIDTPLAFHKLMVRFRVFSFVCHKCGMPISEPPMFFLRKNSGMRDGSYCIPCAEALYFLSSEET